MDYQYEYTMMKAELGKDGSNKLGAILQILEIGNTNIAQAKQILKYCDRCLELGLRPNSIIPAKQSRSNFYFRDLFPVVNKSFNNIVC